MAEGQLKWFVPDATEASVRAANEAVHAAGGGVIYLPDATITLTSALPAYDDVEWVGILPRFSLGIIPDNAWTFTGGTVLQGDGTFPCFQANNTDLGSSSSGTAYSDAHIAGFKVRDMGFDTFTSAFAIGAVNNPGVLFSDFRRLWILNSSSWAADFTNPMHSNFEYIFACSSTHGIRFRSASPTSTLIPGNMTVRHVYVNQLNHTGRGIVFEALSSCALNEVRAERVQCNRFNGTVITQAATMANGSPNITVTDGTKFPVGMPMYFDATANGFTANRTYVVLTQSGNVITVGSSKAGSAINATGSTAVNAVSNGMPNVEIVGFSAGGVQQSRFLGLDIEGYASASLYAENVGNCEIDVTEVNTAAANTNIVLRNVVFSVVQSLKESITDFDTASYTTIFSGTIKTMRQARGVGIWNDHGQQRSGLNLGGSITGQGWDIANLFLTGGAVVQFNKAWTIKTNTAFAGTVTLDVGRAGHVLLNAGTNNITLPTVTNASNQTSWLGVNFWITNLDNTNAATINTDGTQVFNGQTGKTTVTIPPGGSAIFAAHASLGWAIFGEVNGINVLTGSTTYDPASIASGAQTSTTLTVTGAALGNYVEVATSIDAGGLLLRGYVSAANTVTVVYANLTGGTVDLASHTLSVRVRKA